MKTSDLVLPFQRANRMDVASFFGKAAGDPKSTGRRLGRPSVVDDPAHIGRRAYALEAWNAGETQRSIAARMGVRPGTLWYWRSGKLGPKPKD